MCVSVCLNVFVRVWFYVNVRTHARVYLCVAVTDLQCKSVDRCLELFGGWGYMMEYPVARAFVDARVQPIYGGCNAIMKELIARSI